MYNRNRLIVPAHLREPLQFLAQAEGVSVGQYVQKVLSEHIEGKRAAGHLPEARPASSARQGRVSSEPRISVVSPSSGSTRFQPWAKC